MNISPKFTDDMIVCKYSRACDIERRTVEHVQMCKKIKSSDLRLKYYGYVDNSYTSDAEM